MFVVHVDGQGYVEKRDGTVIFHADPSLADKYADKEDAERGKIGHHRDMGGSGFKGRIVPYASAAHSFSWLSDRRA
jgi:hypothetical protein